VRRGEMRRGGEESLRCLSSKGEVMVSLQSALVPLQFSFTGEAKETLLSTRGTGDSSVRTGACRRGTSKGEVSAGEALAKKRECWRSSVGLSQSGEILT